MNSALTTSLVGFARSKWRSHIEDTRYSLDESFGMSYDLKKALPHMQYNFIIGFIKYQLLMEIDGKTIAACLTNRHQGEKEDIKSFYQGYLGLQSWNTRLSWFNATLNQLNMRETMEMN